MTTKKRAEPQDTKLGVSKISTFCWKIQLGALGPGTERCLGYISSLDNTPEKLILRSIFPLRVAARVAALRVSG